MYHKYNLEALGYSTEVSEIKAHKSWSPAHLIPLRSLFTKMIPLTLTDSFFCVFYFLHLFRKNIKNNFIVLIQEHCYKVVTI